MLWECSENQFGRLEKKSTKFSIFFQSPPTPSPHISLLTRSPIYAFFPAFNSKPPPPNVFTTFPLNTPTRTGNYAVQVNVYAPTPSRLPILHNYLSRQVGMFSVYWGCGKRVRGVVLGLNAVVAKKTQLK